MNYTILTSEEQIRKALNVLSQSPVVGCDTETTTLSPRDGKLRLIQLSDGTNTYIIDVFKLSNIKELNVLKQFFLSDIKFVFFNYKFDSIWINYYLGIFVKNVFDAYLAAKLIDMKSKSKLNEVLARYLDVHISKEEQRSDWTVYNLTDSQYEYAARDAFYLSKLRELLVKELFQTGQQDVAKIEFDAAPVTGHVEESGFPIDKNMWLELAGILKNDRDEKEQSLLNLISPKTAPDVIQTSMFDMPDVVMNPADFNPRSWQQIIKAYAKLGIDLPGTNEKVLTPIARTHPEVKLLMNYRHAEKSVTTYGETFLDYIDKTTGRIHSTFFQLLPNGGRYSSQNPNVQNIPNKEAYRACFHPLDPERVFLIIDYSQIELRVVASIANDVRMMEAFRKKQDLHSTTAKNVFNLTCDIKAVKKLHDEERQKSKVLNFQILYGVGPQALADKLGISFQEAKRMIKGFYDTYPELKQWLFNQEIIGLKAREVRTLSGRLVKIDYDPADSYTLGTAKRLSRNGPVQGGAADIFKSALPLVYNDIKGYDAKIVNLVHDEVIIETTRILAAELSPKIEASMKKAAERFLQVPIEADAKICSSWSEK